MTWDATGWIRHDSESWADRIDRLRRRAHRPWIAIRGEDLRLLLAQTERARADCERLEAECDRLRREIETANAAAMKTAPKWEQDAA